MTTPELHLGQMVTFAEDPNPFTVQAISESGRWIACTRNWCDWDKQAAVADGLDEYYERDGWPDETWPVYTVLDMVEQVRGRDNAVGGLGYENRDDCEAAVALLDAGEFEHSVRGGGPIPLRITAVTR